MRASSSAAARARGEPLAAPLIEGTALQGRLRLGAGVVHARRRRVGRDDQERRQDAAGGQDGHPRRRSSGHPRVRLVQGEGRQEKARVLEAAGYDMSLDLGRLVVDPVSERKQLGARFGRVHGGRGSRRHDWNLTARTDGSVVETMPARELLRQIRRRSSGAAPTPACSTTRRSTRGTRCRIRGG